MDNKTLKRFKTDFIAGHSGHALFGTKEQLTNKLCMLADVGPDGDLMSWVDDKSELQQWFRGGEDHKTKGVGTRDISLNRSLGIDRGRRAP